MTTSDPMPPVTPAVNLEREALLAVHALDRRAHFETSVPLILDFSPSVGEGIQARAPLRLPLPQRGRGLG